jgi:hypothetical protein
MTRTSYPGTSTNDRPILSSGRATYEDKARNCQRYDKNLVMNPRSLTPRRTDWLTVSRNVTLTLTLQTHQHPEDEVRDGQQLSNTWDKLIQSTPSGLISVTLVLISLSHLLRCLPSCLSPSNFPTCYRLVSQRHPVHWDHSYLLCVPIWFLKINNSSTRALWQLQTHTW